jgi:hypothetical protein
MQLPAMQDTNLEGKLSPFLQREMLVSAGNLSLILDVGGCIDLCWGVSATACQPVFILWCMSMPS